MTNGQAIKAGLVFVVTCPRRTERGSAMVGFPSSKANAQAFLPVHLSSCQYQANTHSVMDIRAFAKR